MYLPVDWPITDLVGRQARRTPSRIALNEPATETELSYEAWSAGPIADVSAGLRSVGIGPGDHVGVLAEPGRSMATLVHAVARTGAVLCPLPPEGPAELIEERCSIAAIENVIHFLDVSRGDLSSQGRLIEYAELKGTDATAPTHRWNPDDPQWLVFTSGTTGQSRAVRLTTANLVSSATASALRLGVAADEQWLACLPMHHVGGLSPLVRSALYGTAVTVQGGFDAVETASIIEQERITGVSLVPTMLKRLLDNGWQPPERLRFVLLGGAPATPDLISRCEAVGVPVHPTYGATETASQVATARPDEAFSDPGTVGRPLPGIEVSVIDSDREPVSVREMGELVVSGPMVSPGYYGADEASRQRFVDGAFRTRDRGYRNEAGQLWIVGRLDAAIVTGGETVQPETVSSALEEHPSVDEAAVVGLPDDEWGEVVAALVTPSQGQAIEFSELQDHASEHLEPAAVPKRLVSTQTLPRTASGTIDRTAVRDRLRAARADEGL